MDGQKDAKSSFFFRAGSLVVALGFLGFLMIRASGGCSKATTNAESEAPSPAIASGAPKGPAPEPSERPSMGKPLATTQPGATPAEASSQPKPYFPATKAAPLPWAQEQAPNPPPQTQAPSK